jgi:hypothetical protein
MLEVARHQWDEGTRRLESESRDPARARELFALVESVSEELSRRVGQTFTLAQLADTYAGAEEWVRDVIVAATPERARTGIRDAALVQDAAFARYARGATDYRP